MAATPGALRALAFFLNRTSRQPSAIHAGLSSASELHDQLVGQQEILEFIGNVLLAI